MCSFNSIEALTAIQARLNGEYDNPKLRRLGPLDATLVDIKRILSATDEEQSTPNDVPRDTDPHVLLRGNLSDGFKTIGPFDSFEDACAWDEQHNRSIHLVWVMSIQPPSASRY